MSKNQEIDNIIFDLGGVLYRINYWETFSKMGTLLGIEMGQNDIPDHINEIVRYYNAGLIRTETFLWKLQKEAKGTTPLPQKLISAWNAMLIGWEEGIFEFLLKIKSDYNLYLYSNINDLHFNHLIKEVNSLNLDFKLEDVFEGMAFSHQINHVKPDVQAFKYVLNLYDVNPVKTLFIDDFQENVDGAINAGMLAVCHDNVKSIKENFFSYLELVC
ncbi:MAG: HAD-IA family hydrolase [Saprospiraceae bacterium]|nr:HAD-IA family hydrolase [Saprospiraceae bacterium]